MEIRCLRDSELERAFDLDAEAFHVPAEQKETFLRFVDPARMSAAFDGDRLVGMCGALGLAQYFGGRAQPMAGLSSVAVAPDWRGRGLSRDLMRHSIAGMQERGEAISTLYPATTALYRSMGWEVAGSIAIRQTQPAALRGLAAPGVGSVRPLVDADWPAVRECYEAYATPNDGCIARSVDGWERRLDGWKESTRFVFEGGDGAIAGYLVYRQIDGEYSALGGDFGLVVDELVTLTRDAALGLFGVLASWGTQVDRIIHRGSVEDAALLLLPEQRFETLAEIRWMTRVIDPVAAVAGRGFLPGLDVEVPVWLRDEAVPANDGTYRFSLQKGRGTLERTGSGEAQAGPLLDIRGFSALFTGWARTVSLERTGLLQGGTPEQRAGLDAAFAGPAPFMLEEF